VRKSTRSAEEEFFNPAGIVDHRRENNFRDFCANLCRSREEDFFNPADIAGHRGENLCRDFCANPCLSAEEEFLIPLLSRITAKKITSGISA